MVKLRNLIFIMSKRGIANQVNLSKITALCPFLSHDHAFLRYRSITIPLSFPWLPLRDSPFKKNDAGMIINHTISF